MGEAFGEVATIAESEAFRGRTGQVLVLPTWGQLSAERLGLVGLGRRSDWHERRLRGVIVKASALASGRGLNGFSLAVDHLPIDGLPEGPGGLVALVAEGAAYAAYQFDRYRSVSRDEPLTRLARLELVSRKLPADLSGRRAGQILGDAVCLARDLVNEPPSVCTPSYLADKAEAIAADSDLTIEVIQGVDALESASMRLLAAVGRGSDQPPLLIHATYRADQPTRRVALVGKGVTYDSGGYSLKPPAGQVGMHGDMAGAAAVLGAAQAISQLQPPGVEVHFIVPSAENLVSGNAYKVNDVLTGRNGQTVEVSNTDAEGRLLLGRWALLCRVPRGRRSRGYRHAHRGKRGGVRRDLRGAVQR